MKKIFLLITLIASAVIYSCTKSDISTVNVPEFDVVATKQTYKTGDTVNFKFTGNPDFITFYSGETGFKYSNINRTSVGHGKPTLQFTSYASTVGSQANSLKIMASTDFTGTYDTLFNSIKQATWIDITPRATLSTGADNVSSGIIDISDIDPDKKPIYFAFKKHDDNSPTLKPYAWTIRSFAINLLSTDDNVNYPIATLANAGWYGTDILNPTYKWSVTGTALSIGGGPVNTPENEDWLISNPINIYNVPPDVGVAIKGIDARLPGYSYIFKTPGTYTVTFVAANQNVKMKKQVVKQLSLTVTN